MQTDDLLKITNHFSQSLLGLLNKYGFTNKPYITPQEAQVIFNLSDNSLRKIREKNPNVHLYHFPELKNKFFKYEELLNAIQPVGGGFQK